MRVFFIVLGLVLLVLFTLFPGVSTWYASLGLALFFGRVFPSLFPFTVSVECLKRLGAFRVRAKGRLLPSVLRLFAVCSLSSAPSGSILADTLFNGAEPLPTTEMNEKSVFSALLNLAGPAFTAGAAASMLNIGAAAPVLAASHYGAALVLLLTFVTAKRIRKRRGADETGAVRAVLPDAVPTNAKPFSVFPRAVFEAVKTMLRILGTLVFFVVLSGFIEDSGVLDAFPLPKVLLCGMLEMTNGVRLAGESGLAPKTILCVSAFLISFGGVSVAFQAFSAAQTAPLPYLLAKLVHGILAALTARLILFFMPPLTVSVFGQGSAPALVQRFFSIGEIALSCFICGASALLASFFAAGKSRP